MTEKAKINLNILTKKKKNYKLDKSNIPKVILHVYIYIYIYIYSVCVCVCWLIFTAC